jgi:hypothetical protein
LKSAAPWQTAVPAVVNSGRGRQHADPRRLGRGKACRNQYSRSLWHGSSYLKTAAHATSFEQCRTCKIGQISRPYGRLFDKSASNLSKIPLRDRRGAWTPAILTSGRNRRGGEPVKVRPPFYQSISSWQASSSRARSLFNRSFRSRSAVPAFSCRRR